MKTTYLLVTEVTLQEIEKMLEFVDFLVLATAQGFLNPLCDRSVEYLLPPVTMQSMVLFLNVTTKSMTTVLVTG